MSVQTEQKAQKKSGLNTVFKTRDQTEPQDAARDSDHKNASSLLATYHQKYPELKHIPPHIIRKAWFTFAHMILPKGAKVVDMGCDPEMTFTMATFHPDIEFIGVDLNSQMITAARRKYKRDNLSFKTGDIAKGAGFEAESVDAVINSFILHEVYSHHQFDDRVVTKTLAAHFDILKAEGLMFVRDFPMPAPGKYVQLEMPDIKTGSRDVKTMSEAELLLHYAENAKIKADTQGMGDEDIEGFFIEECPPRYPKTRLFRLPYKWAYEFIIRKDNRDEWDQENAKEYSFFTKREFRKNLRSLGARVVYSTPYWDDRIIKERFSGHFRLLDDNGQPLGTPPTSFIALAQKTGQERSLRLHERRPGQHDDYKLQINAIKNRKTGVISDIVSTPLSVSEILPYRISAEGELNVFVHDGVPRALANAVPRAGRELDEKIWSGHMIEPITMPTDKIATLEARLKDHKNAKALQEFTQDHLGIKASSQNRLYAGKPYISAPDFIDDIIETRYFEVAGDQDSSLCLPQSFDKFHETYHGFSSTRRIREVSAQRILDAIHIGMIPNARLEIQLRHLFAIHKMTPQNWLKTPLALDEQRKPERLLDGRQLVEDMAANDARFQQINGTAGQLRNVKSSFVDEALVDGGFQGVRAKDIEFVVHDSHTVNKAVVIPINREAKTGKIMAGMVTEYLPVPQRHSETGLSLSAPSFNLPREIKDIDSAKLFIAKQFDTTPDRVARLGESYFCHVGVTPTRIFPFYVTAPAVTESPAGGPIQFAPLDYIYNVLDILWYWRHDDCLVSCLNTAYEQMGYDNEMVSGFSQNQDSHYDANIKNELTVKDAQDHNAKRIAFE
jgi:SAM-dependent methyltransferase